MKILIVDDEKEIANLVTIYLSNEGYEIDVFYDGKSAMEAIKKQKYDLAILDVMLPDIDGFTICKNIRETYTYPIIMLTAKEADIDKINGLMIGADDYVTKPFGSMELLARVRSQLRRYEYASRQQETHRRSSRDTGPRHQGKGSRLVGGPRYG